MRHFSFPFAFSGHHGEHDKKGGRELQTVQEADYERQTLQVDEEDSAQSPKVRTKPEDNPSQRPLNRLAHDPGDTYARANDAVKRSVYAQDGDVEPSEFRETVAELLKEDEYGIFRLFVPSVELGRQEFDDYVAWLNKMKPEGDGTAWRRSIYGLPILPPFSAPSLAWTCLMTAVDLSWTAFGVPINVAFCSLQYGRLKTTCTATDLTFGIIYALNLLVSFNIGMMAVNGHRKKSVLDGRWVAWFYVSRWRFVWDVAATIPFVYLVVVLGLSGGQGSRAKWVNAVSLIRLIRLLRLVSVSKVIHIDQALGTQPWLSRFMRVSSLYVLLVAFQIAVLINLFACVLLLLAYMHGLEDSWMTAVSWTDLTDSSRAYQWYCAVYWVVTTTTTTGFGDFSPRWWAEQVVIGMAMVGGMIAFGLLVGSVANSLAKADTSASRLQNHIKKISLVNTWLSTCELGKPTATKIQKYFAELYVTKQSVQYGEAELFADLPPYLRFEVASGLALPQVRQVHCLRDLNPDAQQLLASHLRPLRAIVGQELCRQGDEADRLWLLTSGRLVALRHKEEPQHVAATALVGESLVLAMDIPQCRYRPWTLRAAQPCQLWELRLQDLSRVMQIYPAVRLSLMDHVRKDLVRSLWDVHGGSHSEHIGLPAGQNWCELAVLLHSSLVRQLPELRAEGLGVLDFCIELSQSTTEDGSLQALLSAMVEDAMVRDGLTPEALLGLPLEVQQQAAAAQQHQQRHTPSSAAPASEPHSGARGGKGPGAPAEPGGGEGAAAAQPRNGGGLSGSSEPPSMSGMRGADGSLAQLRRARVHDSHYGPAPWGVTTEDAIASSGRFGNPPPPPPPPPPPAGQQGPGQVTKDSNKSWHSRPSPQRMCTAALPPQGLSPAQLARPVRRVASYQNALQRAGSSGDAGGGSGNGRRRAAGYLTGGGGGAGAFYGDVELTEADVASSGLAASEGGGGLSRQATPPPGALSPALEASPLGRSGGGGALLFGGARQPRPLPSPPLEIREDPIAAETGVLSPHMRARLREEEQQQHHHHYQPLAAHPAELPLGQRAGQQGQEAEGTAGQGTAAAAAAAGGPADIAPDVAGDAPPAAAAAAPAAGPAAGAGGLQRVSGPTGPPPPLLTFPVGPRRSILSRMSSPFATTAADPFGTAAAGGGGGESSFDEEGRDGRRTGGTLLPMPPPPPAAAAQGGGGGSCAACGAQLCPQCGTWLHTSAPQPQLPPGHNPAHILPQPGQIQIQMQEGAASGMPSSGGGPLWPQQPTSLVDVFRNRRLVAGGGGGAASAGGVRTAAAASKISLRRRSAVPWPGAPAQGGGAAPTSPRQPPLAVGGGPPGSPTGLLARRSRMFGRSFAASVRADSLIRNTLRRDTLWNVDSQREDDELASPSVAVRTEDL